jgi:hypothetical protein
VSGPFETEREARAAAAAATGGEYTTETNCRLLFGAIEAAGVTLGTYDRLIVAWLAGWERATCAVVAGPISRAHASVLDQDDRRTVLDALDVAADHKRDLAANCGECETCPAGLCPTCEWRMDAADAYDRVAAMLRGGQ